MQMNHSTFIQLAQVGIIAKGSVELIQFSFGGYKSPKCLPILEIWLSVFAYIPHGSLI